MVTRALRRTALRFRRDDTGSVAVMFGASLIGITLTAGMAIDYARAAAVRADVQAALDSASLAAAKTMSEGVTDPKAIAAAARTMFDANYAARLGEPLRSVDFKVVADTATKAATVTASVKVATVFMTMAGIPDVDVGSSSSATADGDKLEVAMMVDMTGSMASRPKGGTKPKIDSLKAAAADFVDTMLPANGVNASKVRIGFVPFSEGVNAGTYASAVSGGKATRCVSERFGADANTDAPPSAAPLTATAAACPTNVVRPLTNDRAALLADTKAFSATGTTAGHVGTQWARYVLSSRWSTVWPAAAAVPAGTKGTKKIAILMTDGLYNTSFDASGKPTVTEPNPASTAQALAACQAMDRDGITVYTIGFDLNGASGTWAKQLLQDCASTVTDPSGTSRKAFYDVTDDAGLKAAYQDIAQRLLRVRVTS